MDKLLLHTITKQQITQFSEKPSHTLALIGTVGSGKGILAATIAADILHTSVEKLASYPYFRTYKPENGVISIETVRSIISFTKLKTVGIDSIRRVIIIEDAQALTTEAQNALLKTLEEPPVDTLIILTLTSTANILPTILSRLQSITVQSLEQNTTEAYFVGQGHKPADVRQYYFMSGGLPGLMHALLAEANEHPLAYAIQQAKTILQSDSFERLLLIDNIVKQKRTEDIINALCTIGRSALHIEASRTNSQESALRRWSTVLRAAEEAQEFLGKNAQPKLVLTNLFLHI